MPHDLITIFKEVGNKDLPLPLTHSSINALLREYAIVKKQEICDELYAVYEKDEVEKIFHFLEKVNNGWDVSYSQIRDYLEELAIPPITQSKILRLMAASASLMRVSALTGEYLPAKQSSQEKTPGTLKYFDNPFIPRK